MIRYPSSRHVASAMVCPANGTVPYARSAQLVGLCVIALLIGACASPAGVGTPGAESSSAEPGTTANSAASTASAPVIKGQHDPALLAAGQQAVRALGDTDKLLELAADEGINFYPAYACKPNLLGKRDLSGAALPSDITIETCHEDDPDRKTRIAWSALLTRFQQSPALHRTQSISLDERGGIGIDTGTSYLAETTYPSPVHRIVVYYFLGTADASYRDWDEIGFVFHQSSDESGDEFKLVAVYHDYFSSS